MSHASSAASTSAAGARTSSGTAHSRTRPYLARRADAAAASCTPALGAPPSAPCPSSCASASAHSCTACRSMRAQRGAGGAYLRERGGLSFIPDPSAASAGGAHAGGPARARRGAARPGSGCGASSDSTLSSSTRAGSRGFLRRACGGWSGARCASSSASGPSPTSGAPVGGTISHATALLW
jgi:hypothetical protein